MHRTTTPSHGTACRPRRGPRQRLALTAGISLAATSALLAPAVVAASATPLAAPMTASPAELSAADLAALEARAETATSRSARSAARGAVPAALAAGAAGEALEAIETEPEVIGKRYAREAVNVRTKPDMDSKVVTVLDRGAKVTITDAVEGEWRGVVHKGELRWMKADFLVKSKPKPRPRPTSTRPSGVSGAACASGSGVESGLTSNAIAVHRAVCNAFPSVTGYGGVRGGGGNHGAGRALDIMVSGSTGDAIAAYVRANAARLGVTEVIWAQRIWTTQRASEGWRPMSDRGSATANHYDHVHVSVR
jgi:hypothetical protein